jgi:hypothetical protein
MVSNLNRGSQDRQTTTSSSTAMEPRGQTHAGTIDDLAGAGSHALGLPSLDEY